MTPPDPPIGTFPNVVPAPEIVVTNGNDITVKWQHQDGVVEYRLQETAPDTGWHLLEKITDNFGTYHVGIREPGEWGFRLRATFNLVDYSRPENESYVTIPVEEPPMPEREIDIDVGSVTWELILTEDSVTAIRREQGV